MSQEKKEDIEARQGKYKTGIRDTPIVLGIVFGGDVGWRWWQLWQRMRALGYGWVIGSGDLRMVEWWNKVEKGRGSVDTRL